MKNTTIKDVASYAGLSITTVSRYINNNYPVSASARKKIEEAIRTLGYKPNLAARSLKSNNSGMIGLVVADIANRFFMKIAKGLEEVVSEQGYQTIFASSDGEAEKERGILTMFEERRVDALIIASSDTEPGYLNVFAQDGTPVVAIDRWMEGLRADAVLEDNWNAAYQLMNYLLDRGHKDIAFQNVNMRLTTGRERFEGAMQAMREHNLEPSAQWISPGGFTREDSVAWARKIFSGRKKHPTAVFCANNMMTEGTLIVLKDMGLAVPEDVSLVSFGEVTMRELIEPSIVSVRQNPYELGNVAGRIILRRLQGDSSPYRQERYPVEIVEGESVKDLNGRKAR